MSVANDSPTSSKPPLAPSLPIKIIPSIEIAEKAISASIGALITSLVVTPLDVVKVRMQAQHPVPNSRSYVFCTRFYDHVEPCSCRTLYLFDRPQGSRVMGRTPITGTLDGVLQITRNEGVTGLWRGLSPTLLMAMPATVVYFVGYEAVREALQVTIGLNNNYLGPLLAGSSARFLAVSMISPLELLKTKMQHRGVNGDIISVGKDILSSMRKNGPGVLYKGLIPTLWRDIPFSAIYWVGYEHFRKVYKNILGSAYKDSPVISFLSGATSGVIAASLTTPFDVAKTRQQVEGFHSKGSQKNVGIVDSLLDIWRREGLAGLTRGIVPRVCKVAPSCAIMVGSYEFSKSFLASRRHQHQQ